MQDIVKSVNITLESVGLPARPPQETAAFIGKGVKDLIEDALGEDRPVSIGAAIKIYKDAYRRHIFDTTVLYPGTVETLKYFKNTRKAIMSNKSKEFIDMALDRFAIRQYFVKVAAGDDEKQRKPSIQPVIKMLEDFKVKPQRAVIVGDSPLDIETGNKAGILACGALYGIGKKEEVVASRPDFLITSISELKDIFE